MSIHIRRRVAAWGNGYGIRLTKAEAESLGVRAGDTVDAQLHREPQPNGVANLPKYRLGGDYDVDAILEEEADGGR